jgi:hypothetical protein
VTSRHGIGLMTVAALAALASGCGGSASNSAGYRDASASADAGSADASSTSGTGGAGGSGGGAGSGGGGGSGGSGGSGGGVGVVDAGGGDAGGPFCYVVLTPVSPPRFTNLPAGKSVRVHADVVGPPPRQAGWRWSLQFEAEATRTLSASTADAEIPLDRKGQYLIRAEAAPGCAGSASALAVDLTQTPADYWLRALPPAGSAAPIEGLVVSVPPGTSVTQRLDFKAGGVVTLEPMVAGTPAEAVSSYVRVTSPRSGLRQEGHTGGRLFSVPLDRTLLYDVLVIPDGALTPTEGAPAPRLFPNITADFPRPALVMDRGLAVSGQISSPAGPVSGARVLLRSGDLPSTAGISDAQGRFTLQARAGAFGALVVPPTGMPLVQARIAEGAITVGDTPLALTFSWRALPLVTLDLNVRAVGDTGPAPGVLVRLQADSIPGAGTMTIGGSALTAAGVVQAEATTGATGTATFTVPAASYQVMLTPPDGAGAVTLAPLDLRAATGRVARPLTVARKLDVAGRLIPASLGGGATVVAIDPSAGADPARPVPTGLADSAGVYRLAVDPGHPYRLFVEPAPARGLARIPLGPIAGDRGVPMSDHRVPGAVAITGVTTIEGTPVAGALVQVYCLGASPDCKDPSTPSTERLRPIAEAVSGGDGSFRLVIPDPAMVY